MMILQHSPDDIPKLYEEMNRSGADVVYAHFIEKKAKGVEADRQLDQRQVCRMADR